MQLKLLVADDEDIIRKGIAKYITFIRNGLQFMRQGTGRKQLIC